MTGFGQALGQWYDAVQNVTWHWSVEVKSVNHRALDVRVRAGGAMDDIERDVRSKLRTDYTVMLSRCRCNMTALKKAHQPNYRWIHRLSRGTDQLEALNWAPAYRA